tara:strand:- start:91 stop:243 length:153 start_codon:yes stop_codon:yes gene_type:complete
MAKKVKRLSKKELEKAQEEYVDFWSRCLTESFFWLAPYVIVFVILGFIFN